LLVLLHEVAVLRRTRPGPARIDSAGRAVLAALIRQLPRTLRARWSRLAPLLRWHRSLARKKRTYPHRQPVLDL
jgi:putative transposase